MQEDWTDRNWLEHELRSVRQLLHSPFMAGRPTWRRELQAKEISLEQCLDDVGANEETR